MIIATTHRRQNRIAVRFAQLRGLLVVLLFAIASQAGGQDFRPLQGAVQVTAGHRHSCALTSTGAVLCWGDNDEGQMGDRTAIDQLAPEVVPGLNQGMAKVSAGGNRSCALTTAGAVMCWGKGRYFKPDLPHVVEFLESGVSDISVGDEHVCVLTDAGGVKCWGNPARGRLGNDTNGDIPYDVDGLSSGVIAIAAGGQHTCAVTASGAVKCWGWNHYGQLGIGDDDSGSNPVPLDVPDLDAGITAIATGYMHTCALTSQGGVKCWGSNREGQVGNGADSQFDAPVDVQGLDSGVVAISAGLYHTCAVRQGGAAQCWGNNTDGQVGDGDSNTHVAAPVDVHGLGTGAGVLAVAAGSYHSCALLADTGISCWGLNDHGQGGDGGTGAPTALSVPGDVVGLSEGAVALSAGDNYTCVLTQTGGVKCWGANFHGQLGEGSTNYRIVPADVQGLAEGVAAISAGPHETLPHTCARMIGGTLKCWGNNEAGQLGIGSRDYDPHPTPLAAIAVTTDVASVSAGSSHTCIVTGKGAAQCWGDNISAQLGIGPADAWYRLVPQQVTGLTSGIAVVDAGGGGVSGVHTCAVTSAGAAKCWGSVIEGQLGNNADWVGEEGTPVDVHGLGAGVVDIVAGPANTCAIRDDDALLCWGDNSYAKLGVGPSTVANVTVPPAESPYDFDAAQVSIGEYHLCAVTTQGALKCWGRNDWGQLGNGLTTQSDTPADVLGLTAGVAQVAVGDFHTCALTIDGAVKCWGINDRGQLGAGGRDYRLPDAVLTQVPVEIFDSSFETMIDTP